MILLLAFVIRPYTGPGAPGCSFATTEPPAAGLGPGFGHLLQP